MRGHCSLAELIDRLGHVRQTMNSLSDQEEELKKQILAKDVSSGVGRFFALSVIRSSRVYLDVKRMREELPSKILAEYTVESSVTTVATPPLSVVKSKRKTA